MPAADTLQNTKNLESFRKLKPHEQYAVTLKARAYKHADISKELEEKFGKGKGTTKTIEKWFIAGGRLEQAYHEFLENSADAALDSAKKTAKALASEAIETLADLMRNGENGHVKARAALGIAAKYLPDKQVVLGPNAADDDLPEELSNRMTDKVKGGASDNPPADQGTDPDLRSESDESVAPEVLSEPGPTDGPSDPPA